MLQPPNAVDASTYGPPSDPIQPLREALRGRYEIERQIGQGAYATVFLARDLKHERKVALKVLNTDPTSDVGEIRFVREIRTLARLQHPNILPLHDSGHVEALLYYVMPYVSGDNLRDRIDRERILSVEATCAIGRDIADALAYAHGQGVVHRDIKPENILFSGNHPMVADFGIARIINVAGIRQLTKTGMGSSPGTPAYMSPEQLLGDRQLDGRSDIYSLGCVLYEMLTGKPPFAGKEGFAKRFTEPAPLPSAARKGLPPWVDDAISRALQRDPVDRYPTADEFVRALCAPAPSDVVDANPDSARAAPPAIPIPIQDGQHRTHSTGEKDQAGAELLLERPRWRNSASIAILVTVLIIVAWFATRASSRGVTRLFGGGGSLDTSRFVVLPFATPASADSTHPGNQVADRFYDALTQWEGLPVVPDTKVAQAMAETGTPALTEREALRLARRLGAGKLVWGQTMQNSPDPRVRVYVYDVATGETGDSFVFVDSAADTAAYRLAVIRLLGGRNRVVSANGGDGRTRSFRAWQAYGRAHAALKRWDLPMAEREFRNSVNADDDYRPARLWLAQVMSWQTSQRGGEWVDEASRAAVDLSRLDPHDQLIAAGLSALADGRFPAACDVYARLVRADSTDFLGWYGLGECQLQDNAVLPSARSPSHWAFRSSYHFGARAFLRALKEDPGGHAIFSASKLQRLLPIASTIARSGVAVSDRNVAFAGFPTLDADTVAFVPYPLATFALVQRGPNADAALRRNGETLFSFANNWAKRFPTSAGAQEALSEALEAQGQLGDSSRRNSPALRAIDSALALSHDKKDIMRLKARQVRLHFKRGEFASARALTDSILLLAGVEPAASDRLEWIAALTGRADLMARYWLLSITSQTVTGGTVPPVVAQRASKFFAYAALGLCGGPLTQARDQLDVAIRSYVDSDIRQGVEADMSARAASLASPCTGGVSALRIKTPTDVLQKAQQAYAKGEVGATTTFLDAAKKARRDKRPGDLSPDYIFQNAWLRVQVGDTAGAIAELDAELETLPAFSAPMFADAASSAAFGRAMGLRSQLAAKRGDWSTAVRWARSLDALWGAADPALRDVVDQVLVTARLTRTR